MSDQDFVEDALQNLRPAQIEPALMARLSAARPREETPRQISVWRDALLRWVLPVGAGACVAIGTFQLLERNRENSWHETSPTGIAAAEARRPVESLDYLMSARPVGIVVAPNRQPYRIMDVEWLEYQAVGESAAGPVLHTATTRRDVIPVALELY